MTCHNCERRASWLRTRCRTCESRLPAWYVFATMGAAIGIYVAFLVVESVF